LVPNQAGLNALDGFSTTAVIRERFAGALDVASLTAPGAVVVVHITTSNTTKAPVPPPTGIIVPLVGCAKGAACTGADYEVGVAPEDPTILEITPLKPLAASSCLSGGPASCPNGEGYLVLLTKAITEGGAAATPDTDYANFQMALQGGATCPSITVATLNALCQLTGAHLALAQALMISPANVVASFSFSTESTIDTLTDLAALTTATSLTVQHPPGFTTAQLGKGLPGHADIYVGVLDVPYYLSKSAPLTEFWHAPPFPPDPTSTNVTRFNPVPVPTAPQLQIPVLLTVPNASSPSLGVAPAGGWPVLIFQHGITRNREDMFALADSFADAGFVVAAIDLPLHGITDPTDPFYAEGVSPMSLYTGLGLPASGSIERTFDLNTSGTAGAIDPSGIHFINLTSLITSRDNLRQGVADLIVFARTLPQVSGVTGGINANAMHFLGHSLGGIVGGTFMGVVPAGEIVTATLANPGGKVAQLLRESPTFAPQINAGLKAASAALVPGTTLYEQWWRDAQTIVDSGDPVNFIALATTNNPIHLIQVVGSATPPTAAACIMSPTPAGCPDQVVPNSATQRLILASGLTQVHPPGAAGPQLDVFVNFTAGTHGSILDPTSSPAATVEMQTEAIAFALTSGTQLPVSSSAPVQ
ncbi:MAG TPA: hypothetical protein VEY89_10315, partial [Candidatus Dormibacteraeota bacterium]|nr:hypothetical protein [Candidatus Dormibacteraeota bacterium]